MMTTTMKVRAVVEAASAVPAVVDLGVGAALAGVVPGAAVGLEVAVLVAVPAEEALGVVADPAAADRGAVEKAAEAAEAPGAVAAVKKAGVVGVAALAAAVSAASIPPICSPGKTAMATAR
jgi:hypothetical protein